MSSKGCPVTDTILSLKYFSTPQKHSFKSQGGKKKTNKDPKDYRVCNTYSGPCGFWVSIWSCPLAHRLKTGEQQSPLLAYKYIGDLCDRPWGCPPPAASSMASACREASGVGFVNATFPISAAFFSLAVFDFYFVQSIFHTLSVLLSSLPPFLCPNATLPRCINSLRYCLLCHFQPLSITVCAYCRENVSTKTSVTNQGLSKLFKSLILIF